MHFFPTPSANRGCPMVLLILWYYGTANTIVLLYYGTAVLWYCCTMVLLYYVTAVL